MNTTSRALYVSYNGALEEIAPSQVIPYLRELAKDGLSFVLVTFEKRRMRKEAGRQGMLNLKNELSSVGIEWHWLPYHKRPSLAATAFDILLGTIYISYLTIARRIRVIHGRSIVAAVMCLVPKLCGTKFIFDTRGLLAEEYVGGGHWREKGIKYNIVKFFEKYCLLFSDAVVVLTERHRRHLLGLPWFRDRRKKTPVEVIPCCVDLNRFRLRKEGQEGSFVFTYLGKIGKHYMLEEMLDFLKIGLELLPDARFMILTQNDKQDILSVAAKKRWVLDKLVVKRPDFKDIPYLVSLSRAGIFFINPYKKFASSPIKLGEFLSCGIPVIINSGIGDTEELVKTTRVGVVIDRFEDTNYKSALSEFLELLKEGDTLNKRCRKVAEGYLSLEMGAARYGSIYKNLSRCTV